nr:DnaJ domain-containing protein [uncultured Desulfobacter sp.]
MDKQKGLDILGLGPSATRTDARTAFRRLAKTWHPDRFATDPTKAKRAEEKMKQLNEAFHILLSLLPQNVVGQEDDQRPSAFNHDRTSTHGSRNLFQDFFSTLVAGLKKHCHENKDTSAKKTGRFGQARPHCREGKSAGTRRTAFETVFQNAVKHNREGGAAFRTCVPKRSVGSSAGYRRYFNSAPGRSGTMGCVKNRGRGPVEAINPISPMSPVKRR